jgi:autotransporter translocation and assembly factor TamB
LRSLDVGLALRKNGLKLKRLWVDFQKIKLGLKGEWKGDLERGSFKIEGDLEAPTVLSEILEFAVEGGLEKKLATFRKIEAQLGEAIFNGTGTFDTEKLSYNLSYSAKDLPLEAIFSKMKGAILPPSKGIGEIQGKAEGRLPQLSVSGKAAIRDFKHGPLAAHLAEGTLTLDWPSLDFEAFVKPGEEERVQLNVKGGVLFKHLPGREKLQAIPKTIDLTFDNSSLSDILPSLKVAGRADGVLNLKGTGDTSVQGTGHAKIVDGRWALGPVDWLEADVAFRPGGKIIFSKTAFHLPYFPPLAWPGPIELDTSGDAVLFSGQPATGLSFKGRYDKNSGHFRFDSLQIRRDGGTLDGSGSFHSGGKVDAKLKGNVNLEWLHLLPSLFREARGMADLDLSLSGSVKEPFLRGQMEFHENEIAIRGIPEELSGLKGTLKIEESSLTPKLSGLLGDGEFRLEGKLGLARWKPEEFDLSLQGRNLTLSRPNIYRIDFDADVSLKGRTPSPLLEGRIDIVDGRYTKPFVVRELVLKPFELPVEQRPWEEKVRDFHLNLIVKNSGDIRIQNNIADIFLQSDLQIGGTYGRPRVGGALTVTEGEVRYLGNDFTLNEGRLEFIDPSRREPYLTLVAEQEIPPDYTVFVEVKGFLSNLEVSLTSSPALPKEEIFSLITVGMTQEELEEAGRSRGSVAAGRILAEEISTVVGRPVSKTTGLDIFRLEASESGTLSRVAVGKHLTDRFSLEFRGDFAPETAERTLQANYYLTDNILLKGFETQSAGTTPKYQLNISFRLRLR